MCSVCVSVFLIYTISVGILCVSQEGLRLADSNYQIYDFQFSQQQSCSLSCSSKCVLLVEKINLIRFSYSQK